MSYYQRLSNSDIKIKSANTEMAERSFIFLLYMISQHWFIKKTDLLGNKQLSFHSVHMHYLVKCDKYDLLQLNNLRGFLTPLSGIKKTEKKEKNPISIQFLFEPSSFLRFMVLNATFNNISVISWRSVLLLEETGVPRENHWPVASHWQTLSHNVVSSTPRHEQGSNSQS